MNITCYESPSGNTQIYIVRKKRSIPFAGMLRGLKTAQIKQKMLGLGLIATGIVSLILLRYEDCTAPIFLLSMGLIRLLF